jgi:hypothetical protein
MDVAGECLLYYESGVIEDKQNQKLAGIVSRRG